MTTPVDICVDNGVVITMDSQRRILADGGVAIRGTRILGVARTAELRRRYSPGRWIDAHGGVIRPGYIDCHVHLSQHLGRSTIPDSWPDEREHEQWLPYWTHITEEEARYSALLGCMEMARNGTTTFCDSGARFAGELNASAAEEVGMRGLVSEVCWDRPPHPQVSAGDTGQCLTRLERLIHALPHTKEARLGACVGLAGMGSCSDELLVGASRLARETGLILDMHESWVPRKPTIGEKGPRTPVEHLADLGVLGPHLQLVHMIHSTMDEVALLAESATSVVHCPGASARMAMGVSRVGHFPEMLKRGITVGLGSDSGNYSDSLDIGRQGALTAALHRDARGDVSVISAEDVLEMSTVNGARSLGLEHEIGSLEAGKKADLVIHSTRFPELHPRLDVVTTLVHSAQSRGVDTVIIDGRLVLEAGHLVRVNEETAYAAIDGAAHDLFARAGIPIKDRWPRE